MLFKTCFSQLHLWCWQHWSLNPFSLYVLCACGCNLVQIHFYSSVSLLPQLWDALTSSPCVNHQAVYRTRLKKEKRSLVYPAGFSELCNGVVTGIGDEHYFVFISVSVFVLPVTAWKHLWGKIWDQGDATTTTVCVCVCVCALLSSLICYFKKTKQRTVLHDWGAKNICVTSTTFCRIRGFHTLISYR